MHLSRAVSGHESISVRFRSTITSSEQPKAAFDPKDLNPILTRSHRYEVSIKWTGNTGSGTSNYRSYEREYEIKAGGDKPLILGSSERIFRGNSTRWNPEELLVASISACHELWYLHLCAVAGIIVVDYVDHSEGFMEESEDGSGRFIRVILKPQVKITKASDAAKALELHTEAHAKCFISNSVNFPVLNDPLIETVEHTGQSVSDIQQ